MSFSFVFKTYPSKAMVGSPNITWKLCYGRLGLPTYFGKVLSAYVFGSQLSRINYYRWHKLDKILMKAFFFICIFFPAEN